MNTFKYLAAPTSDQAAAAMGTSDHGRYLAGGIDLLGEMKEYIVSPELLVALKHAEPAPHLVLPVPAAPGSTENVLHLPAYLTMAEIEAHPEIVQRFPALAKAASEVGSPQIRNVATLGGNLLQHSRCWYYRQPDLTCLKRGGATCYAVEGENKYLALFSGCACVSPVVSNTAVALAALDARIHLHNEEDRGRWDLSRLYDNAVGRKRNVPLSIPELYAAAWTDPAAHNSLHPRDLVVSITVPLTRTHSAYLQQSEKREFDWALVNCAAAGNVADGKITDARIALGAVAPGPYMVEAAHQFLEGKPLTEETVSQAADLILKDAKPLSQNGYKVPLAHTLIRRTLLALNA